MQKQMKVQIGKFTLESLTTGMYSDAKIVYREYIQNAVDSLEEAVELKIIEESHMRIDIIVAEDESRIMIRDNGVGISEKRAFDILLSIGNSQKRYTNNRGFRGIGRLGGMSYCDTLVFTTSAFDETTKTTITFDCKKLRELLSPGTREQDDLSSVISKITEIKKSAENKELHYFSVEMIGIDENADLLDIEKVKTYISQVAPVPYKLRQFTRANELHSYVQSQGFGIEEFPIYIGKSFLEIQPICKANRNRFKLARSKGKRDEIINVEYFNVTVDEEIFAVGWFADCEWLGSIASKVISGFRLRKGNILIGDKNTLDDIFKEARFNGWVQGEIFVVTDKLTPNARRDNFEQNEAYFAFINQLSTSIGSMITSRIRMASKTRNDKSSKILKSVESEIEKAEQLLCEGFNSSVEKNSLTEKLTQAKEKLEVVKVKPDQIVKKKELQKKLEETEKVVVESNNYKINTIKSGVDRKSKKVLATVSDILSKKLSKFLVDEIMDEIVETLNGR